LRGVITPTAALALAIHFVRSLLSLIKPCFTIALAPVLVESLSEKAYELLQHLEALNILRVISKATPPVPPTRSLAGSLSDEAADELRKHTEQVRSERERTF